MEDDTVFLDDILYCIFGQMNWDVVCQRDLALVCKQWQKMVEARDYGFNSSRPQVLTRRGIEICAGRLDWKNISCTNSLYLSEEFLDKYDGWIDWNARTSLRIHRRSFSIEFIERHKHRFNWRHMANWQRLSEELMTEHATKLWWPDVYTLQKLSPLFMIQHEDKMSWNIASRTQLLPEELIIARADKVDWPDIFKYQKLSESFIIKNIGRRNRNNYIIHTQDHICNLNWCIVSRYQSLSRRFLSEWRDHIAWSELSCNPHLTEDIIDYFSDRLDWFALCSNFLFSEKFIEEHIDLVNWSALSIGQDLSEDFITKYSARVNWTNISATQKMSVKFMTEYTHMIDWEAAAQNKNLDQEFVAQKHFDLIQLDHDEGWQIS